ncbi:leucine-rich repeat and calponin homology domain-containing protein 2-like isoform X6 [Clytia hemisphaerica]|uniref:leucine-rich repeat and calponin homology domain-containing protein 2-like isoform X6 n=1 Tax=Clytia hemisphaerica TaxID=252671 RepID=UPI0034D67967
MSSPAGVEKCFEEAQDSGVLKVCHKGLKCFPNFVDEYDLLDVLNVDISKNRFVELPQEVLSFVMMEKLVASHNFLKTLPDLSNLNALTYLDISQNQMQTIPVHTCSLPLKILKASHNKITVIPCEIGLLSKLQSLDISCNELTNLPSTLGDLTSLRMLNVRRNVIVSLPDELSKLKNLCNLNFSCNRISNIPPAFRLISSLIELDLTNNPLSSPPAQICLKGRLHIVKFLSMAAQQQEKRWSTMLKDKANRSPSTNSLTTTNNDSEKHLTDKQLGNEVHDIMANGAIKEMDVLSDTLEKELVDSPTRSDSFTHKSELGMMSSSDGNVLLSPIKPKLPRKPEGLTLQENREKQRILQEKGKLTPQFKTRMPTPTFPTTDNQMVTSPTQGTMSLDRNVGRQVGSQVKSKDSNEKLSRKNSLMRRMSSFFGRNKRSESLTEEESPGDKPELSSPNSTSSHTSSDSNQAGEVVFEGIAKRGSLKQRNNKILKDGASNYTMRRFYDVAKEEFEKLEKLREAMESKLRIKLPDDLPASLSDGIVLCHLINHLRKGTIQVIHVPSSGVPKLTMPKCQMNVDAFLDACRRVGVEKVDVCTAPDILEEKSPIKLCRTVEALMQVMGVAPPQISIAKPTTPR